MYNLIENKLMKLELAYGKTGYYEQNKWSLTLVINEFDCNIYLKNLCLKLEVPFFNTLLQYTRWL